MTWSFYVEPGGLVWPDPGEDRSELKRALDDCAPSLSPNGTEPVLSTYWIDHVLAGLTPQAPAEARIGGGNAWSLSRRGELVAVTFDHDEDGGDYDTISVDEFAAGLVAYRDVVVSAIENGHQLEGRRWAQKNPY